MTYTLEQIDDKCWAGAALDPIYLLCWTHNGKRERRWHTIDQLVGHFYEYF